jgi:2-(1,2-epoxy-1,2-dihydrophenyl)acetyl-CoA isomerase
MTAEPMSDPRRGLQLPPPEEREWQFVQWSVTDTGALAITLNRPAQLNALNFAMLRELLSLMREVAPRPEVRVVTLQGAGPRAFSSGDDLKGMNPEPGFDSAPTAHHPLAMLMRELPKPVVALLHGFVLGAGFELALACDLRLAADNLEMGDHRATRAIAPIAGSTWFLPRIVGYTRALDLLFTGRHLDAAEALAWGLVNYSWPAEEFEARAGEYVDMLARMPTRTLGAFKLSAEYGTSHSLRDSLAYEIALSGLNRETEDAREGRASFLERRDPMFKGH